MGLLDGWAEAALKDFGPDLKDGTLIVPGTRTADGQGGFKPGAPVNHTCKALVTDYSDLRRQSVGIPATDRQILVLAASLPAEVVPAKGHRITAWDPAVHANRTFEVIAKTGDPAGAIFKLQGR